MQSRNRFYLKQAVGQKVGLAQQLIAAGDNQKALQTAREALAEWRGGGGPKNEEGEIICLLGKSMVGLGQLQEAFDLYIEAMNHLTGEDYDEVYRLFLWLNERMGTFDKKTAPVYDEDDSKPSYPSGYYDDFNK